MLSSGFNHLLASVTFAWLLFESRKFVIWVRQSIENFKLDSGRPPSCTKQKKQHSCHHEHQHFGLTIIYLEQVRQ